MLNKGKSNQNEKTRNRTRYLLKEKSMKNILKVRMLGGFTLEYKGKELVLDRNNVSKTTQLFQLLLLHTQDGGISKAALIDALYGRSDVENKNGSLNNTIFRLRKQLTAAGLPESSYININGGMCTWDPDIETSVEYATSSRQSNQHVTKNPKRPKWKSTPKHGNSTPENSSRI